MTPASKGATVVLQLKLKEHFGWWPVQGRQARRVLEGPLHAHARPQGPGARAADRLRRGHRARAQQHVPPTLGGMPSRILVVGGGAIGGITAAQMDADVVVLDANEAHVAALRDPGLVYEQEGDRAHGGARRRRLDRRARGRVRLRAGRGQVAAAPRRARAAGRARRDRRVRLDGQRADPGPHGGHRRRRATCWPASSSGAGPTSGRGGSCATRSAATWSASSTGRSPTARASWRAALEPVGTHARDRQRARDDLVQAADQLDLHRAQRRVRAALRRRRRAGAGGRLRALGRGRRGRRRAGPVARAHPRRRGARVRAGRARAR